MSTSSHPILRIGTRGSPLARVQATMVAAGLAAHHPDLAGPGAIETVIITTTGDRVRDRPLAEIGGKGLFTKEIEEALYDNRIDLAVHSMKDVPTVLPDGLFIAALLPRANPHDVLILHPDARTGDGTGLAAIAPGRVVGTSALRRAVQIQHARPDLKVVPIRGNVDTRMAKVADGTVDATLLALAGLERLNRTMDTHLLLTPDEMLPAVAQGAIGIECREGDEATVARVAALNDPDTAMAVAMERGFLAALDGSCRTPIAAHATRNDGGWTLDGLRADPDGGNLVRRVWNLDGAGRARDEAAAFGFDCGRALGGAGGH